MAIDTKMFAAEIVENLQQQYDYFSQKKSWPQYFRSKGVYDIVSKTLKKNGLNEDILWQDPTVFASILQHVVYPASFDDASSILQTVVCMEDMLSNGWSLDLPDFLSELYARKMQEAEASFKPWDPPAGTWWSAYQDKILSTLRAQNLELFQRLDAKAIEKSRDLSLKEMCIQMVDIAYRSGHHDGTTLMDLLRYLQKKLLQESDAKYIFSVPIERLCYLLATDETFLTEILDIMLSSDVNEYNINLYKQFFKKLHRYYTQQERILTSDLSPEHYFADGMTYSIMTAFFEIYEESSENEKLSLINFLLREPNLCVEIFSEFRDCLSVEKLLLLRERLFKEKFTIILESFLTPIGGKEALKMIRENKHAPLQLRDLFSTLIMNSASAHDSFLAAFPECKERVDDYLQNDFFVFLFEAIKQKSDESIQSFLLRNIQHKEAWCDLILSSQKDKSDREDEKAMEVILECFSVTFSGVKTYLEWMPEHRVEIWRRVVLILGDKSASSLGKLSFLLKFQDLVELKEYYPKQYRDILLLIEAEKLKTFFLKLPSAETFVGLVSDVYKEIASSGARTIINQGILEAFQRLINQGSSLQELLSKLPSECANDLRQYLLDETLKNIKEDGEEKKRGKNTLFDSTIERARNECLFKKDTRGWIRRLQNKRFSRHAYP